MKHIVIIGGGVIGLSVASECAKRGHRVTVIERARARRGASFGNAGMVVPSHFTPLAAPGMVALGLKWMWNPESPFFIKPRFDRELMAWMWWFWRSSTPEHVARCAPLLRDLHLASRTGYERIADDCGLVKRGLLMLCKTQRALDEESQTVAKARGLGVPAEVLDAKQTAALDPDVTMDVLGSVHFPQDCHLQPERYIGALERQLGDVLLDAEVSGWRREGGRLTAVITTSGEISGDEFVLAGGAWSPELVRELGLRLPMQAGKGYSITLPHPVELPRICSILTEARVAVTPMGGALRVGGTMEIAGMDERINPRRIDGIVKAFPDYFPRFNPGHFAGIEPWSGLRPCSPDGLPYLGRTRAAENLIVATGHSMMGLSLAPITGELVAQLADGEPPRFDLALLSPDRYA
ncbi:FAD-dependent oxidoreductase [soil metagenome]